jgi:hypothetical protein
MQNLLRTANIESALKSGLLRLSKDFFVTLSFSRLRAL